MIDINIAIDDVVTNIMTDQQLSFDAIESLLNRAANSTLNVYKHKIVSDAELEDMLGDDE